MKLCEEDILIEHEESEEQQGLKMGEIQKHDSAGEIQIDLEDQASSDDADDNGHLKILEQSTKTLGSPVLPQARVVAQELINITDEDARWDLIIAVWVEMLYHIAPRCGGWLPLRASKQRG